MISNIWKYISFILMNALLISFAIVLTSNNARAMTVTPLVLEMGTNGAASRAGLRVVNDGSTPLPVDIKVLHLDIDEQGKGKTTRSQGEFAIFPSQAMIPAGGSQTFRVQWTGRKDLEKSKSYIFAVNQIPVKFPNAKSGVQVVFNFAVVVNVAPSTGSSALILQKVTIAKDAKGRKYAEVLVQNSGNRHASLGNASLLLTSGKWSQKFTSTMLRQQLGVGLVQPRKRRKFRLKTQLPPQITSLKGDLTYQPASTR
jgi:P pilus assembly chaperone PapD